MLLDHFDGVERPEDDFDTCLAKVGGARVVRSDESGDLETLVEQPLGDGSAHKTCCAEEEDRGGGHGGGLEGRGRVSSAGSVRAREVTEISPLVRSRKSTPLSATGQGDDGGAGRRSGLLGLALLRSGFRTQTVPSFGRKWKLGYDRRRIWTSFLSTSSSLLLLLLTIIPLLSTSSVLSVSFSRSSTMLSASISKAARPALRTSQHRSLASATSSNILQHSWKGTNLDGGSSLNLIGGEWAAGSTSSFIDIHDPATQRLLSRVPETSHEDMVRAVDKAEEAFDEWKDSSVLKRQAVMLK